MEKKILMDLLKSRRIGLGKTRLGVIEFYFSTVSDYKLSISPTPRIDTAGGVDRLEKHSVTSVWYQKDVPVCICKKLTSGERHSSGLGNKGLSPGSAAYQLRKVAAALRALVSSSVHESCKLTTPLTIVRVT